MSSVNELPVYRCCHQSECIINPRVFSDSASSIRVYRHSIIVSASLLSSACTHHEFCVYCHSVHHQSAYIVNNISSARRYCHQSARIMVCVYCQPVRRQSVHYHSIYRQRVVIVISRHARIMSLHILSASASSVSESAYFVSQCVVSHHVIC